MNQIIRRVVTSFILLGILFLNPGVLGVVNAQSSPLGTEAPAAVRLAAAPLPIVSNPAHDLGSFTACSAVTGMPQSECEALVALYNGTGGTSWTDHTGWLVTNTPCSWYGVTCGSGHVTELVFENNLLSGSIPTQLGNLTALQGLDLSNNQLGGSIPAELGNLTALQGLLLSYNQLEGSIPTQLGNLTNLTGLDLDNNWLTGSIPTQLGSLTKLKALILDNNQLSGSIPSQLGSLTNLTDLDLNTNWLSGTIPTQLGSLSKLDTLKLSYNGLTGIVPSQLSSLGALEELDLNSNALSGSLPLSLKNLSKLEYFYFNDTNLCEPDDTTFQTWLNGIYHVDTILCSSAPPNVASSVRASANPSSAASVNFTVTFTQAVTGVDKTDFSLTTLLTGASVSSVSGSGTTYSVAVATGSGDGALRLNVINNNTIINAHGVHLGGSFLSGESYTINKTPPGAATLVSPLASVTTGKPTFVWSKVSAATLYRLWIKNSGGAWVVQNLYSGANICGAANCGATLTTPLVNGTYTWYIQTLTASLNGAWSGHSFTVAIPAPGVSTLVSPKGTIHLAKPTFIWSKDSVATLYRLWIKNNTTSAWVIQNLYAGKNICGVTNCAIVSPVTLANGSYTWYIDTLTATQNGQWSAQAITVSVPDVVPSPSNNEEGVKK